MVTAILIPIICLYFYFLTKKEVKLFHEQWNNLDQIREEAVVTGEVIHISEEKQRFYYHRYVHCLLITLQGNNNRIVVKKLTPIKSGYQVPKINIGEVVHVYGNWENKEFRVTRIEQRQSRSARNL
jgi:hypothetical protein